MSHASRELATQVHTLMKSQADLLDEIDRTRRDARRDRDALLLGMLEVMDSTLRGIDLLDDEQGRSVLAAVERQIELAFASAGIATYRFEPGVQPPLGEIDVVETGMVPEMADLAVIRTIHPGLRDNKRILRKAAVAINRSAANEEA